MQLNMTMNTRVCLSNSCGTCCCPKWPPPSPILHPCTFLTSPGTHKHTHTDTHARTHNTHIVQSNCIRKSCGLFFCLPFTDATGIPKKKKVHPLFAGAAVTLWGSEQSKGYRLFDQEYVQVQRRNLSSVKFHQLHCQLIVMQWRRAVLASEAPNVLSNMSNRWYLPDSSPVTPQKLYKVLASKVSHK